jgi:Fur family ferric uptake transcriptional regulator
MRIGRGIAARQTEQTTSYEETRNHERCEKPVSDRDLANQVRHRTSAEILRRAGQRATPQRVAVLSAFGESGIHLTAEEIFQRVEGHIPGMTLSTVYRTLELLRDIQIVTETDLGEGVRQYELIDDEPHHHLICSECGYMIDFDDSAVTSLRDYVIETYGFEPHLNHLAIFGRCPMCKASSAPEDA